MPFLTNIWKECFINRHYTVCAQCSELYACAFIHLPMKVHRCVIAMLRIWRSHRLNPWPLASRTHQLWPESDTSWPFSWLDRRMSSTLPLLRLSWDRGAAADTCLFCHQRTRTLQSARQTLEITNLFARLFHLFTYYSAFKGSADIRLGMDPFHS